MFAICFILSQNVLAQVTPSATTTAPASPRILGEVKEINKDQNWLTIKTSAGEFRVNTTKDTVCKRVAPDAKNLDGAEAITFRDILLGDRVWARNTTNLEPANTLEAKQLVLMSAISIADRNKRDRENWQRRGIVGEVTAIDGDKVTLKLRDNSAITLTFTQQADIRRYPLGSIDFSSSKPIPASEIKVGDNVFGRGERSADNQTFQAEFLITGDVPRPTFGQIAAINLEKQEITVKTREKETIIQINPETLLRRMSEDAFTQRQGQDGNGQASQPGQNPQANGQTPGQTSGQTPGQNPQGQAGGQRRGGMFNPEAMMERLRNSPVINLTELKVGDFIVSNGPKLDDGKSIKALFVMKIRIPNNPQQGPSLGPGGGFGDFGPQ